MTRKIIEFTEGSRLPQVNKTATQKIGLVKKIRRKKENNTECNSNIIIRRKLDQVWYVCMAAMLSNTGQQTRRKSYLGLGTNCTSIAAFPRRGERPGPT